ncbi:MAG: hypothetical protein RIT81_32045 [Deltaproteobacteria bacterium]
MPDAPALVGEPADTVMIGEAPDVAAALLPSVDYGAIATIPVDEAHALVHAPVLPSSRQVLDSAVAQATMGLGPADASDLRRDVTRALGDDGEERLATLTDWVADRRPYPWADDATTDVLLAVAGPLKLESRSSEPERQVGYLAFERLLDDPRGFVAAAEEAGIPAAAAEHIATGPTVSAQYDRYERFQQTRFVLERLAEVAADRLVEGTPAGEGALAWSDNAVERQVRFGENVGVLGEDVLADIDGATDALFAGRDTLDPSALAAAIALRVTPDRLDEVEQMQILGAANFVNLGESLDARRERAAKVIASFVTLDRAGRPPTERIELERDLRSVHDNLTGGHKHYDAIASFVGIPGEHARKLQDGFEFELTNDASGQAQWGRHWKKKRGVFDTIANIALSLASFIPSPIAPIAALASSVIGAVQAVKSGNLLGIVSAGLGAVGGIANTIGRGVSQATHTAIDFAKRGLGAVRAAVSGDPLAISGALAGLSDDPLAQRVGAGLGIVDSVRSGDPAGIVGAFVGAAEVERSVETATLIDDVPRGGEAGLSPRVLEALAALTDAPLVPGSPEADAYLAGLERLADASGDSESKPVQVRGTSPFDNIAQLLDDVLTGVAAEFLPLEEAFAILAAARTAQPDEFTMVLAATLATGVIDKTAGKAARGTKVFSDQASTLLDMLRGDRRRGPLSLDDAEAALDLAEELGLPHWASEGDVTGTHFAGGAEGEGQAHIHVGRGGGNHFPVHEGVEPREGIGKPDVRGGRKRRR